MDIEKYAREGGKSFERYYREWVNEVEIHLQLNECQEKYDIKFSPCIYDWWYCDDGEKAKFYILIERYQGDLVTLLENKTSLAVAMTLDRMHEYLGIIHYTCRVCLNDISLRNMLYKQIGVNEYEIVFADFGMASTNSDDECIRIDGDRFIEVKNEFMISRYG
jgi:tRNA A-37 threonylcarbamoyl transferase component Bud32